LSAPPLPPPPLLQLTNRYSWEFPAESGAGNEYSSRDSTNFLLLLEAIRATKIGKELVLSAAVSTQPFTGPDGAPLADVSMFAMVLDFVEIMVYDIFGTDDPRGVGPNAPLNDTCSKNPAGSAVSAVKAWTGAHFPAYQLSLGVASYGHHYNISRGSPAAFTQAGVAAATCGAFGSRVQSNFTWDGTEGVDACGNALPSGGIWDFNSMVGGGYLDTSGKPADGIEYRFDSCSQTVRAPAIHAAPS
jgi:chitinase